MIFFYFLFSSVILYLDYMRNKCLITPTVLTIFSYDVALLLYIPGKIFFNYKEINDEVFTVLLIGIFFIWLPSLCFPKAKKKLFLSSRVNLKFNLKLILFVLFVLQCIFVLEKFQHGTIGSEEFEKNYSQGLGAHFLNLYIVCITYLLCFIKFDLFSILFIIFGLFFTFLSGTKYHLIFIFLVVIQKYLYRDGIKKIIKIGLICFWGVFLVFSLNYFLGFIFRQSLDSNFLKFVTNHFFKYVSGGLIGFSEMLNGAETHGLKNAFVYIDSIKSEDTNVYSIIGYYFLRSSFVSLINIFCLSFLGHLVLFILNNIKITSVKNSFFLVYTFFWGNCLFLSFFSPFYLLFNVWEWAILACLSIIYMSPNFANFFLKYNVVQGKF